MTDKTVKHERDEAVPEFMNDIVDDMEYIPRNERLGRAGRLKRKYNAKWLPVVASVVLVLIVVLTMVFDNEEKSARETANSPETGLARIEERLEVLETKIALMEKMTRPTSNTVKRYHTVRPGDSLSAIAGKYGTTVDRLCKLNQMTVDEPIRPGQKLLVSQS